MDFHALIASDKRKKILRVGAFALITLALLVFEFMLLTGAFRHGAYADNDSLEQFALGLDTEEGVDGAVSKLNYDYVTVGTDGIDVAIRPDSSYVCGVEVAFRRETGAGTGFITFELLDNTKNVLYEETVPQRSVINGQNWYRFTFDKCLHQGSSYKLRITAHDNDVPVEMLAYPPYMEKAGGAVVLPLHEKETFNSGEQTLMSLFVLACWLMAGALLFMRGMQRRKVLFGALFITLFSLLSWSYMFGAFDVSNTSFASFQSDSQGLVTGAIEVHEHGLEDDLNGFGLGRYEDGRAIIYGSNLGLQGKVFCALASMGLSVHMLLGLAACGTALVLCAITFLVGRKYNLLLAIIFYITFLFSPWIVNFARNLYWVEFTWFIPLLLGLVCSLYIKNRKVRLVCYIAVLAAVAVKCLCGYEYVSAVIVAALVPLCADFVNSLFCKDKKSALLLLRTVVLFAVACLAGFVLALLLHGALWANGDLLLGVQQVLERVAFRNMGSADYSTLNEGQISANMASHWEVLAKYPWFATEIITGIPGNVFPLLALGSAAILIYNIYKKQANVTVIALYVGFILAAVSWFYLAKGHSYIHTHMNYVLWYFGYVQMCFYVVVNQIARYVRYAKSEEGMKPDRALE